jgi:hypothetical protein
MLGEDLHLKRHRYTDVRPPGICGTIMQLLKERHWLQGKQQV